MCFGGGRGRQTSRIENLGIDLSKHGNIEKQEALQISDEKVDNLTYSVGRRWLSVEKCESCCLTLHIVINSRQIQGSF